MFDPLTAGVQFALGLIKAHRTNEWLKLLISCHFSGFCTFFFVWGTGGIAHLRAGMPMPPALAFGFCEAMISMAAIVYFRFTRDPLAKGIKISVPGAARAKLDETLEKENVVTAESGKE